MRRLPRPQLPLIDATRRGPWLPDQVPPSTTSVVGVHFFSARDARRKHAIETDADVRGVKPEPWQLSLGFGELARNPVSSRGDERPQAAAQPMKPKRVRPLNDAHRSRSEEPKR